jgi:O-acetyl-ADP-ribose deacetylase (regulator of RNase III)
MNDRPATGRIVCAYTAGSLGAFLIVGALAWAIHRYAQPPPLGEDRAVVRAKALAELRAAEAEALASPAWIDQAKGLVRLPIEQAMMLAQREWGQNPAAARSNLIARVEKATAVPPKAPEKPSPFE